MVSEKEIEEMRRKHRQNMKDALTDDEQAEPARWAGTLPDAHKLAMEYEFRGDNGDYTPTEAERVMLEDFGNCLLSEIEPAPAAEPVACEERGSEQSTPQPESRLREARLREALANLVQDIDDLVSESEGVAGLHLNGDVAEWDDLLPGGPYERLTSLDDARAALKEANDERA